MNAASTKVNPSLQALPSLRIVVIAPELVINDPTDAYAINQAERSRSLRIGLLENGFNLVAVLPADTFLNERLTQLQPDMIIVVLKARRVMRWSTLSLPPVTLADRL
jgi:AmiR/NasT family two-component response regulator